MNRRALYMLAAVMLLIHLPQGMRAEHLFKIATLAPEGSTWVEHFRNFADEVAEKTEGKVTLRIYPGGVMGDDIAMYRKMRVGQLHGGGFTMTGLAPVVPDFNIMAIPFYFDNYDQVDRAATRMLPFFADAFAEKGLELIAMTEVGFAYAMSTQPTATVAELRRRTSWIPSDDPLTSAFLESLEVNPVPLSIPDVLSSLQTGLIDTVYASLYGAIVMQWYTKAAYVTDVPFGYAYGAVAFDKKRFSRLPPALIAIIREAADNHFTALNREMRKINSESRQVLADSGVQFVDIPEDSLERFHAARDRTIEKLKGGAFSVEAYELLAGERGRQ